MPLLTLPKSCSKLASPTPSPHCSMRLRREISRKDRLSGAVIFVAFREAVKGGIHGMVKEYYGHPVVTNELYAKGLIQSWKGKTASPIFDFLLLHADKTDLKMATKKLGGVQRSRENLSKGWRPLWKRLNPK